MSLTERIRQFKIDKILILILVSAALAHGINMFNYPSYREDEGTYLSQAWAVRNLQQLAPYTYWYDHAPAGWLLIAAWNSLTGGEFVAGVAVNSGRILMLILHIVITYLVFKIAFNLTKRRDAAIIASLLFAILPIGIVFERRVYLDNIMTFWLMISLYFISLKPRLLYYILSALCFAIAVLSKESAIAFFPVIIIATLLNAHPTHRRFAIMSLLLFSVLTISVYPLFALLKGEFFPTGTLFGGTEQHVSLWEAIRFQTERNNDGVSLFASNSSFLYAWQNSWTKYGLIFTLLGTLTSIINLALFRRRAHLIFGLLSVIYILFTIQGQVLDWYIIPLIPIFSINIALVYSFIQEKLYRLPARQFAVRYLAFGLTLFIIVFDVVKSFHIYTIDQTENQRLAIDWVKDNINDNHITMIDNYAFVDLNPNFKKVQDANIHYYWKADTDPQVRYDILKEDWNNIDYLLFTPALRITVYNDNLPMIQNAYENSHIIKRFHRNIIGDEGYPVEIREVNNQNGVIQKGWEAYRDNFITPEGRVIDPLRDNLSTSEGQAYALLRAVWIWEGDKEIFDRVQLWTEYNMKQKNSNLYAWLYEPNTNGKGGKIIDSANASDADEDIALALLFAYKRWGDVAYLTKAKALLKDIWEQEVVMIDNTYYFTSGVKSILGSVVNPSYFSPASYRIFAEVDKEHDWNKLANDTYVILDQLQKDPDFTNSNNLPPNWFIVDDRGNYQTADIQLANADQYGYDAFRTMWRIALDKIWHDTPEAEDYLKKVGQFFESEWNKKQQISAIYDLEGDALAPYSDLSTNAGALSVFYVTDQELAIDFYSDNFWNQYSNGFWGEKENYYNQNWAWFATALYANNLPNLWQGIPPSIARN